MSEEKKVTPPQAAQVDPQKVQGAVANDKVAQIIFELRAAIKKSGEGVSALSHLVVKMHKLGDLGKNADAKEMTENLTLAYRHLEDAAMRLGKTMQAKNGGVSILDK